nr:MAG TPA: hypothetical protein [Caudoviricetes sp.]
MAACNAAGNICRTSVSAHDQGRRVAPSMRRQIGRARLAEKMGGTGTGNF